MIPKRNVKNTSVIKYSLALSLILGALILAVGISGIIITQKLSKQVEKISDTAFGPALAFDEIINALNGIEIQLLKTQNNFVINEEKAELYQNIKNQLGRIYIIKNEQLAKSENQNYNEYLVKWNRNWTLFQSQMTEYVELQKSKSKYLDSSIVSLRDEMSNIRDFIKSDVVVIMENSTALTKWSLLFLSITLSIGVVVALLSSSIIVRHIKNLFNEIDESKKSIEVLFDNLDEGFFIFDKTGFIHKGVSGAARRIFGKDLVGSNFVDILPLDAAKKKQALAWQELAFSGTYDFDDFKSVAPRSVEINARYIELDFRPIYSEDQRLDRVICISIDKTNERKLRETAEEEAALVKLVIEIIKDRLSFSNDIIEIRNLFVIINEELNNTNLNMAPLLRAMHTIKGCSATHHIRSIVKLAHAFESKVASYITANGLSNIEKLVVELQADVKNIESVFESFLKSNEKIFEALMGKENYKTKTIDVSIINELCRLLLQQTEKDSPLLNYFVEHFMRDNIVLSFAHYAEMVKELADRQKKKIEVKILNSEFTINPLPYKALLASLTHIFTNAVDHGIETASERQRNGKMPEGTVTVSFKKNTNPGGETLLIQISDDGRGINWEKVRDKAVSMAKITQKQAKLLSPEESLQLIFMNNFSTNDIVTDISGRGMGTDAVLHEAKKLGGRAWVKSQVGRGTSFFIEVPNFDNLLLSQTLEKFELPKVS